jgi:hypothetical protein
MVPSVEELQEQATSVGHPNTTQNTLLKELAAKQPTMEAILTLLPHDSNLRFRQRPDRRQVTDRRSVATGGRRAIDALHGRIRAEYREMPGLCLSANQASRLWHVNVDLCRNILEALVADGFLRRTPTGSYVALPFRVGADRGRPPSFISPIGIVR